MAQTNPKREKLPDLDTILKELRAENKKNQTEEVNKTTQRSETFNSPLTRSSRNKNCLNCSKDMLAMMSIINDSATKILSALKAEHLLDKKTAEKFKKDQEENRRREKENLLESSGQKLSSSFKRAIAPLNNVLDSIFKFLLFTLAGRVVGKILKWFADPANEKKVKSLTRFLRDWWPALLGAFVLFGTKFGAAIRATVRMAISTILYLKKIGIPGIILGLKKFGKFGLITGGITSAAFIAYKLLNPDNKEESKSEKVIPNKDTAPISPPPLKMASGGMVPRLNLMFPDEKHVNEIRYVEGGPIDTTSGISITGAGPDTQLIAAQPGEIVISKAAVDKFGADTFLRMNFAAGATNKPKFADNIQFARQGGMVGKIAPPLNNHNFNISPPNLTFPINNTSSHHKGSSNLSLPIPTNNTISNKRFKHSQINYNPLIPSIPRINFVNYNQNNRSFESTTLPSKYNSIYPNLTQNGIAKYNNSNGIITPNLSREPNKYSRNSFLQMAKMGARVLNRNTPSKYSSTYNLSPQETPITFNVKTHLASKTDPIKPPSPRIEKTINITELPAIDLRANKIPNNSQAQSEVPDFSAIPRLSDRYGNNGTLEIYGIEL